MADSRNLTFGVQFGADSAPLDELNEKQKQAQQEAEETAAKLEQVGTSLANIGSRAGSAFNSVSGSGNKMGSSVRSAVLESIKAGDSLSKTLKTGVGAAVTNVQSKFKGWGAAAKSVAGDVGNAFRHPIQTIKATLGGAMAEAKKKTEGVGTEANKTGKQLDDMGRKGGSAGDGLIGTLKKVALAAGAAIVVQKVVSAVKDFCGAAIEAAAGAEEMASKFGTVFKDASAGAEAWAENFGKAAKRSKNEVMGFMADSGALFTGMGLGSDAAASMSERMTSLSYDLASFNNMADADAFAKLRSGVMGEAEGLKSMGIVLNDTALKQSMLSMGVRGNFNELSEATKVQVRFNAILAQTSDAQGDVTKTAGSYTNSLKGVKGIWADFLATAGAKFLPVLTNMFNTITDAWPTIEPMLMGLVDLLSEGLSQAIPILLQLGSQLLPVFTSALGLIFQIVQPLIPMIGQFAATLLPPLVQLLSMLATNLLPPIMQIMDVVLRDILMPLMPVFTAIAQAVLPPIAKLLAAIAPILHAIAPVLQFIGELLAGVANIVGKLIGWVADGVGKVTDFFSSLFGGAKEATAGMDGLADSTSKVTASMPEMSDIQMPKVTPPDTSAFTNSIKSAMDTTPIMAADSWGSAKETAGAGLAEIGTAATDVYGNMADQAENAWNRMGTAAGNAVNATIAQLRQLKSTVDNIGVVSIGTSGVTSKSIPGHARGTDNFAGGLTRINEEGGEMAILPSGSQIIPADQTDKIINASRHSKQMIFSPQIRVSISGNASEEEKQKTKAWFLQMCREAYETYRDEDSRIEAIQASLM